jgi:hypothetical protein
MSVVLSIREAMPTPEPGPLTAMLTLELAFMKSSAHTALKGVTVFDPIILNEPVSEGAVDEGVVEGVDVVPQPAKIKAITIINARGKSHLFTDLFKLFFSFFLRSIISSMLNCIWGSLKTD